MNRKQAFIDFVNDLIKNCKYPTGMSEDAEFYWNYLKIVMMMKLKVLYLLKMENVF